MAFIPADSFLVYFTNNPLGKDMNKNAEAFSNALNFDNKQLKIAAFTSKLKLVFLEALHSPINFGGLRVHLKNKVVAWVLEQRELGSSLTAGTPPSSLN